MRDREIVSYYGFSSFASAPEALREIREVASVDGKSIEQPAGARAKLKKVVTSRDDFRKEQMLKDFEKENLNGAAIDFGQLILLFTRSNLDKYTFELNNTGMVGADRTLVISFRQNGGGASLHISDAGKKVERPLQGEVWVREGDYLPLRVTLKAVRLDHKIEVRDEASVDYAPNSAGLILPAAVVYRRFLNDKLYVENTYQYSDWQPLDAK